MKTTKIIASLALASLALSCSKIDSATSSEKDCLVSLCPAGEITTSESPLTRISDSSNDIYAVQVYKDSKSFACGYFDNAEDMKLYLKTGSTYQVIICLIKDAKTMLGDNFSLTNDGVKGYNQSALYYYYGNYNYYYYYPLNRFNYSSNFNSSKFYYYDGSTATSLSTGSSSYTFEKIKLGYFDSVYYPTCTDWFYGEVNDYTPTGDYNTMSVELKRTGFQLKYELSGVTDGNVTVNIYNSTRTFIENTTNTASYTSDTQFIAFKDAYSAWLYADNYTENLSVSVSWERGIGVTQDLGTKTIQVKRNCLNNVRITLGSDDRGAGVNLTTEAESSMGSANTTISASNL